MVNDSDVRVCVATTEDEKREIYAFRYQVYVREFGKPYHNADHENGLIIHPLDGAGTQIFVSRGTQIVACIRLDWGDEEAVIKEYEDVFTLHLFQDFPPSSFVFSSKFIIAPDSRKTSVGESLLTLAYTIGRQRGGIFSFCDCIFPLVLFYEKLGFRRYTTPFEDRDAGTLVPMVLIADDLEHLGAVRSPFLPLARNWPVSDKTANWFAERFRDGRPLPKRCENPY